MSAGSHHYRSSTINSASPQSCSPKPSVVRDQPSTFHQPIAFRSAVVDMPLDIREVYECEPCETLFNGIYVDFRPDRGSTPRGRQGFKELRDRQLAWHKNDSTSTRLKVVDTDIGDKVVGDIEWKILKQNPYPELVEHPVDATWWPEGEIMLARYGQNSNWCRVYRRIEGFANKLMDDCLCPRYYTMNSPHIPLSILYVYPEHRRRGIGSILIRWGLDKVDELGVDAIVEAMAAGKPAYAANGFRYVKTFWLDPTKNDPSPGWTELEQEMQTPIPLSLMVRPKGRSFGKQEGKASSDE
ncbi:MAG: hypothetical protein Q9181_004795 [Wetmoreana brouardii]